jgi:soluble lytic murein transglycosylase-like protein
VLSALAMIAPAGLALAAPATSISTAHAETTRVDPARTDAAAYLLRIPDPGRYQLHDSADWVLRSSPGAAELSAAVAALPRAPVSLTSKRFHAEISKAAQHAGLDPALVHAVIGVESAYRDKAVSPKGAVGLMQVMPETGRRYGIEDLKLPAQNIRAGTRYLSDLMRMFGGDLRLVLAAYNAGENAVIRNGWRVPPYLETRRYVPRVLDAYSTLTGTQPQPD